MRRRWIAIVAELGVTYLVGDEERLLERRAYVLVENKTDRPPQRGV